MSGTLFRVQRFRASCTHQPVQPRFFFSLALTTLSTFHHVTICILYHHPPSSCFLLGEIPSLGSGSHDPRTFLLMLIKPRKVLLILRCVQCGKQAGDRFLFVVCCEEKQTLYDNAYYEVLQYYSQRSERMVLLLPVPEEEASSENEYCCCCPSNVCNYSTVRALRRRRQRYCRPNYDMKKSMSRLERTAPLPGPLSSMTCTLWSSGSGSALGQGWWRQIGGGGG